MLRCVCCCALWLLLAEEEEALRDCVLLLEVRRRGRTMFLNLMQDTGAQVSFFHCCGARRASRDFFDDLKPEAGQRGRPWKRSSGTDWKQQVRLRCCRMRRRKSEQQRKQQAKVEEEVGERHLQQRPRFCRCCCCCCPCPRRSGGGAEVSEAG